MPKVVETMAVTIASQREVWNARTMAALLNSSSNHLREKPSMGKLPNWAELKDSSTTTAMGANMKR